MGFAEAAAAAVRLGICEDPVTVVMPGGALEIGFGKNYELTMLGPVRKVAEGELAPELLDKEDNVEAQG